MTRFTQKLRIRGAFMNQQVEISIPNWLELDGLEIVYVELLDENPSQAVVVVGENLDCQIHCRPIIRIYLAELSNDSFEITKELDALIFESKDAAKQFLEKLPKISAIQLITESTYFERTVTY